MEQNLANCNGSTIKSDKFIVKYRRNYYDITDFLHKHPGGLNTLKGLENSDMTTRFMRAPPHSDAAMYLMREYQMEKDQRVVNGSKANKISNSELLNGLKENIEIIEETDDEMKNGGSSNNNNNSIDESMEVSFKFVKKTGFNGILYYI